jgi:hypothetical protein
MPWLKGWWEGQSVDERTDKLLEWFGEQMVTEEGVRDVRAVAKVPLGETKFYLIDDGGQISRLLWREANIVLNPPFSSVQFRFPQSIQELASILGVLCQTK